MTDDHGEMLARIDERTKGMVDKFEKLDERLDSHAGKIRALEHWRYVIVGGLTVIGALFKLHKD